MKIIFTLSIIIICFLFLLSSCSVFAPQGLNPIEDNSINNATIETTSVENEETVETVTTSTENKKDSDISDQIIVTSPQPNEPIISPLIVKGKARGYWFFEATFPVSLFDKEGNIVTVHYAQAIGEWMTEDFIPFEAELIFEKPDTDTGFLILEKDNPSGLIENDTKIKIPVRFINQSEKTVEDTDTNNGEYFIYAVLKGIDLENNRIFVEQLMGGPDEKEISSEVKLSKDCKIIKVILERPEEKETVTEISLNSIGLDSEIGIIFKNDDTARAIIYQEIIEK